MNDWFWWLVTGERATARVEGESEVARAASRDFFRGRIWWHRVVLGHKQTLIPTNLPDVGPAVWLHCACDRWWSW